MKLKSISLFSIIALAACGGDNQQDKKEEPNHPGMSKGKAIFVANCMQCHKINEKAIGPALAGCMQRWGNDTARIGKFIRNSNEMITLGDARAKQVYEENNKSPMPPMPHLTNNDINELIDYINKGVE
ncbi:MAG: cytochrome c [Flavipsychrobacter sp.]|nr:cytochrome c [Flavipsychrobacter sp.]